MKFLLKDRNENEDSKEAIDSGQIALTPIILRESDNAYKTVEDIAFQLQKGDALNIAVTGPYGSGKSSVLRTLKKDFPQYHYLDISLATLHQYEEKENKKENNGKDSDNYDTHDINQRIEYSILQQLIYKEAPSVLRYSRLKRITGFSLREIKKTTISTIIAIICSIIIWEPICIRIGWLYNLLSVEWLDYVGDTLSIIYLMLFAYKVLSLTISKIGEMKLSKVAVQNAEIELNDGKNSIFNRYLDEILYFFEQTQYNVVLIEDLDRFGTNEIYLKLRELNNILNASKTVGGKRKIFFVYAVRDDMFRDDERTKCFDYITTVLPVINRSNSQDMLRKELQRAGITKEDISDEDVEEIAFFLDDMRLLRNIVNEFIQYKEKLKAGLSLTKLLAIVVYKNYSPRDFADLHKSKGNVYNCISSRNSFIEQREKEIDEQISLIREDDKRKREVAILNERELRAVYLHYVTNEWDNFTGNIYFNNKSYSRENLIENEQLFDIFIMQSQIKYSRCDYYYGNTTKECKIDFKKVERSVNSNYTYKERLESIKKNFASSNERIEKLEQEKREVRSLPLSEILKVLKRDECKEYTSLNLSPRVEFFLIKGYIGEDYYDYISYYYKDGVGLNEHDWQFVRDVKLNNAKDYDYHIDNVEACVKKLPSLYLSNKAILNVQLLDYYSSKRNTTFEEDTITILDTVTREKSWDFLCTYYKYGKNRDYVFHIFFDLEGNGDWSKFFDTSTVIDDILYVIWLKYAEEKYSDEDSQKWIAGHYEFLTAHSEEISINLLKNLIDGYEYDFVALNKENEALIKIVTDAKAFQLTKKNVTIIVDTLLKKIESDDHSLSLTLIYETGNESLENYIDYNLSRCMKEIFSEPSSRNEDEDSIVQILESCKVSDDEKRIYLNDQKQTISLDKLTDERTKNMAMELLLVAPEWKEIQSYLAINGYTLTDELKNFICQKVDELCNDKIPEDDSELSNALFMNNDLSLSVYKKLLEKYKEYYMYTEGKVIGMEEERIEIMISEEMFGYSNENTILLREHYSEALLIKYLEKYKSHLLSDLSNLHLKGNVMKGLLQSSELTDDEKVELIPYVKQQDIQVSLDLANEVLHYLLIGKLYSFSSDFTNVVVAHSNKDRERLEYVDQYLRANGSLQKEDIAKLVKSLGSPYCDVVEAGKKPHVPLYAEKLIMQLKEKTFVSSYKMKDNGIRVYTKNR